MDAAGSAYDIMVGLGEISTPEALMAAYGALIAQFGATAHILGEIANRRQVETGHDPIFAFNWPADWTKRWAEMEQIRDNPVIFSQLMTSQPYSWRDVHPRMHGPAARLLLEVRESGLREGYCIPIHRPRARFPAQVTFAGNRMEFSPEEERFLQICSFHVYERLEQLMRSQPPPASMPRLSLREREALHWIAAGKSVPAIAEILSLSAHTVRTYVKSAMHKLNATTHAQAIAIALRLGEILP